jgi:hypothetical protein
MLKVDPMRTATLLTVGLVSLLAACADRTTPLAPGDPVLAKPSSSSSTDTDSRAVITFDDAGSIRSDGKGSYTGDQCGVRAKIFNTSSASGSGDLVFDPDYEKDRSCPDAPRKVVFAVDGTTVVSGPFSNTANIWGVESGQTKTRRVAFDGTGISGCTRMIFFDATVTGGTDPATGVRTWTVESVGPATCQVQSKGKWVDNGTKEASFGMSVTEVPYSG